MGTLADMDAFGCAATPPGWWWVGGQCTSSEGVLTDFDTCGHLSVLCGQQSGDGCTADKSRPADVGTWGLGEVTGRWRDSCDKSVPVVVVTTGQAGAVRRAFTVEVIWPLLSCSHISLGQTGSLLGASFPCCLNPDPGLRKQGKLNLDQG